MGLDDAERERLRALWEPTLIEVDDQVFSCLAEQNPVDAGGEGFVWLTSDEPRGRPGLLGRETVGRRADLRRELEERGWRWRFAPSSSPSGDHAELGVAVSGAPLTAVLELARGFEQLAVFVVEADGAMRIEWCV